MAVQEMSKRQRLETAIAKLTEDLGSSTSDIGDWKIIKIYEARMAGKPDPYDFDELMAKREETRKMINACQKRLEKEPPDPEPEDPFHREFK